MLFRFLNLSPPCAISAARASSIGVVLAVIAGGAGIVLDAAGAAPLDFAAPGPWAMAAELIRTRTSVGAYLFMAGFLPRSKIETGPHSYTPRRREGSEIKSQVNRDPAIARIG